MSETGFDIPDDVPQIQLGKYRYKNKWDVTEQYKLPQWWRLPEDVRWRHTARNYRKSYDAWTAEFTFDTRKYSGQWLVDSCLLYTSPSPRDKRQSRMPSSA